MKPKIVDRPAFAVVGLSRAFSPETMKQIPLLWTEFAPRIPTLEGKKGWDCYGLCVPDENASGDQAGFTYVCCMEVEPGTPAPEGLTYLEVPAARYAVFTFDDHISRIG
ncbi:MAG: GyrI-like domain-containing protein, partial [Candidatus Eisenbacteria bacterium]